MINTERKLREREKETRDEVVGVVQKNRRKTCGAATIALPFETTIDNSLPKRMKLDNKRIGSAQCSSRSGHYFFYQNRSG